MLTDPRNGVGVPRIQLDAAIAALLKTVAGSRPEPKPAPPPVARREPETHDGIRVYDGRDRDASEPKDRGKGEKRIKW